MCLVTSPVAQGTIATRSFPFGSRTVTFLVRKGRWDLRSCYIRRVYKQLRGQNLGMKGKREVFLIMQVRVTKKRLELLVVEHQLV